MATAQFRKGDQVKFRLGTRSVQGERRAGKITMTRIVLAIGLVVAVEARLRADPLDTIREVEMLLSQLVAEDSSTRKESARTLTSILSEIKRAAPHLEWLLKSEDT